VQAPKYSKNDKTGSKNEKGKASASNRNSGLTRTHRTEKGWKVLSKCGGKGGGSVRGTHTHPRIHHLGECGKMANREA